MVEVACWDEADFIAGRWGSETGGKLSGNYIFIHLGATAQSSLSTTRKSYALTNRLHIPYEPILLFCTYVISFFIYLKSMLIHTEL